MRVFALILLLAQAAVVDKKSGLPLKPERKIEFTTDEGTWMSVDVDRSGKTLIFDLAGDLYTLPMEGGQAVRITSGMPYDRQPVFSPDGKQIAFISDRDGADNLWIADRDGSNARQITKDKQADITSPAWTEDGQYLLLSRRVTGPELWMYHVKGGSGITIIKAPAGTGTPPPPATRALGAVASRDGKYFYYGMRRTGGSLYNVSLPLWQIARRDRRTGDEDVITQASGSAFRPVLSPDGNLLVFGTRYETETGLRIRDLRTGEEKWLKYPVQRDDQESRSVMDVLPGYSFTPDGKEVIASFGGKIHRIFVDTGESQEIPFTAQVSVDLGPRLSFPARVDEGPVRSRLIMSPQISPDGRRMAFSALTKLYVMDLEGGNPVRLSANEERGFQPSWSPDGQWLAYVSWGTNGGHIWKRRADGQATPEQLTRVAGYYRLPVWSPEGSRIVALRSSRQSRVEAQSEFGATGGADVIWVPAAGGDAQTIVPARGMGSPHFGPEKDRLYVYSNQGLLSLRFDGTDRRTHLKVTSKLETDREPGPAQDVRISPDGKMALARVNNQVYLMAIPLPGGETPTVNVNSPSVPLQKLTDVGADSFGWAEGGKAIAWSVGSSLFRQALATVTFDPPKTDENNKDAAPKPRPSQAMETEVRLEFPRHKPQGTLVLRGARVITMKGDEVIPEADIVVVNNRITAVGKRGSAAVPAGARIWELKGSTVMPGIIDVHAHWMEVRRGVLDTGNWSFLANLAYGVTTGRDPQTMTNDMFAYQDLVDTGEILGPRAYSTGPGVFSNSNFQSLEEAKNTVARYKKHYRTHTLKSYAIGNRKQRQWMVEACKEHGIMPTTEGALDLKLDMTHALDGFAGNEHSLPIVPLYKDVTEIYAKSGIFYTPTLLVAYGGPWAENYFFETTEVHDDKKIRRFIPHNLIDARTKRRPWFRYEEHVFPKLAAAAAKIVRAGGRVCIGGHGQLQGIQCHWEMWALASGGLTNMEVLRAATLHGAEAIGFTQDLGSIEPGKMADLVILAKDPLADIRNTNTIRYVMKNGELFEGDTLNQVWPRQKALPEQWWWKER